MAGPGGKEVGRVSIRVVPDTDKFREELRAKLEKIDDDFKIEVNVDLDGNGLIEKVKAIAEAAERAGKIELKVDLDGANSVEAQLDAIARNRRLNIQVDVDRMDQALSRALDRKLKVDIDQQYLKDSLAKSLGGDNFRLGGADKKLAKSLVRDLESIDWNKMGSLAGKKFAADFDQQTLQRIANQGDKFRADPAELKDIERVIRRARTEYDQLLKAQQKGRDDIARNLGAREAQERLKADAESLRIQRQRDKDYQAADARGREALQNAVRMRQEALDIQRSLERPDFFDRIDNVYAKIGDRLKQVSGLQAKALREAERQQKIADINVKFDADESALRAKIAAIEGELKTFQGKTYSANIDLKSNKLEQQIIDVTARLERLGTMEVTPEVALKSEQAHLELILLQEQLRELDAKRASITVDVKTRTASLVELRAQLLLLEANRHSVTVNVDVDKGMSNLRRLTAASVGSFARINRGFFGAFSRLPIIGRLFRGVTQSFDGMAKAADGFANGTVSGFKLITQSITSVLSGAAVVGVVLAAFGAISTLLVIAGAAIAAAWGTVATVIAAAIPALFALAAPIGVVMLGMEGIKKAAKELQPEFDKLKKSTEDAFEKGLKPVFDIIKKSDAFKVLEEGSVGIANALSEAARQVAVFATSRVELGVLNVVFLNIQAALHNMVPGINGAYDAMLRLAAIPNSMQPLVTLINTLGTEWDKSVQKLQNNGQLEAAFSGLSNVLREVTEGLVQLVENGIELFVGAAPGMTAFLDDLTGFFERFDWNTLGAAVGNVFKGIGDTLNSIDASTIQSITDAFTGMGDAFMDPRIQAGLDALIDAIPVLLDSLTVGVGMFAAFGLALQGLAQILSGVAQMIVASFEVVTGQLSAQQFTAVMESAAGDIADGWANFGKAWDAGAAGFESATAKTGSQISESLSQSIRTGLDPAKLGVPEATAGIAAGLLAGLEPGVTAADTKSAEIGDKLKANLDKMPPSVKESLTPIRPEIAQAFANLDQPAQQGMQNIADGVTQSMALVTQTITGSITNMTSLVKAGFDGLGILGQNAFTGLQNSVTLGMAGIKTSVDGGLVGLSASFAAGITAIDLQVQAGVALWAAAITTGFVNISLSATTGMTQLAAAVAAGMVLVQTAFTTGFTVAGDQIAISFAGISALVTVNMALIVAAVTLGMTNLNTAITTGLTTLNLSFTTTFTTIQATVQAAVDTIFNIISIGFASMVNDGVIPAMTALADNVQIGMSNAVAETDLGVQNAIAALEPMPAAFRAAGEAAGQGLVDGLNSKLGAVQAAAAALANAASAAIDAALRINSPSKVTRESGYSIGEGLVNGMDRWRKHVKNSAVKLVKVITASLDSVPEVFNGTLGPNLMGDTLSDVMATQRAVDGTHSFTYQAAANDKDFGHNDADDLINALENCEFKFDRDGVARFVNNSNIRKRRRK